MCQFVKSLSTRVLLSQVTSLEITFSNHVTVWNSGLLADTNGFGLRKIVVIAPKRAASRAGTGEVQNCD